MKYINLEYHPADSRVRIVDDDVAQTLSSRMGTGGGQRANYTFSSGRSRGGIINWNYNELSPTIRAQMGGHPPVVVIEDETDNTDREEVFRMA